MTAADNKDAAPSDSPTPNEDAVGVDVLSGDGNDPAAKPADKATSKK